MATVAGGAAKVDSKLIAARRQKLLTANSGSLDKVRKLIAAGKSGGKLRKAFFALMHFRQQLGEPRVPEVEALVSQIALLEKRPDKAWQYVQGWATPTANYDPNAVDAHLQAGNTLLALGKADQALTVLDWLTGKEDQANKGDQIGSVNVARAGEATGRALLALKRY